MFDYRRVLAELQNNLANIFFATGRYKDARDTLTAALATKKQLVAVAPDQPDQRNELAGVAVNLAQVCQQLGDLAAAKAYLEDALPDHVQVLKVNPANPTYRQFYRNNLVALILVRTGLSDDAGAKQAALALRDLGWDPPGNAFDAARAVAASISIIRNDEKATKEERDKRARNFADEAMNLLRDTVARGFKDAAGLKNDPDLAGLRTAR